MTFSDVLVEVEDGMIYIIINPWGDSTVPSMSKELEQVLSEENNFKPPNDIYSVSTALKSSCFSLVFEAHCL